MEQNTNEKIQAKKGKRVDVLYRLYSYMYKICPIHHDCIQQRADIRSI